MLEKRELPQGPFEYHDCVPGLRAWVLVTGMNYQWRSDGPDGFPYAVVDREGHVLAWVKDRADARFMAIVLPAHRVNEETARSDHDEEREDQNDLAYEDDMACLRKQEEMKRGAGNVTRQRLPDGAE